MLGTYQLFFQRDDNILFSLSNQSFLSHKADVLTLCVSDDEKSVCTAGIEPVIAQFHLVDKDGRGDALTWVRSRNVSDRGHKLCHTHDIKALVFAGDHVVSGGKFDR